MSGAVDEAQHALDLVGRDPRAALIAADALTGRLPRPRNRDDVRAVATAHRAAGLALRDLGDPVAAERRLRRALAVAERGEQVDAAAEARMSLAYVLLERGRLRAALSVVDHASAVLRGVPGARVRATRALVLQRSGRTREALADYAEALPVLHKAADQAWEARLRNNRALLLAYDGDTDAAADDLRRARDLFLALGSALDATDALWNLGWVLGMNGEIPAALELFDLAQDEWGDLDRPEQWVDRAEILLRAGLTDEATRSARTAVGSLSGRGWDALEAESRLLLALCLLTSLDVAGAGQEASVARAMFVRQDRDPWAALADYVRLRSALVRAPTSRDLDRAVTVASVLRDVGWDGPAADLRIAAGVAARDRGDMARTRTLLGPLASRRRVARLDVRGRAWFAQGLLDEAGGDLRRADTALRTSWRVIEQRRSLVGATDLRAGTATHALDLVATGARIAVLTGSASRAFDWAERGRAAALRYRPARPPRDPELARALTRLRWAARADEEARLGGSRDSSLASARARLEADVVRLTRRSAGGEVGLAPVTMRDVRARLQDDVVVQYVAEGATLWAVVASRRAERLVEIASVREVEGCLDSLLVGLRRTLTGFGTAAGLAATVRATTSAATTLGGLLLGPIAGIVDDGPVVVCPTGRLTQVPWAALPARRGRATRVTPSATLWCAARDRADHDVASPRTVLAVAGPGLPGAESEVADIVRLHPRAASLVGEQAQVARVLDAADDASVLHVAAHGRLRVDNPLFSSLELSDGQLTGYDLESMRRTPGAVVLPACSSGAGHAVIADETLGLAWTLMGLGTTGVVAPLLPVPDERTHDLMVALHRGLATGLSLSDALAAAQLQSDDDPVAAAVTSAFVSYGV